MWLMIIDTISGIIKAIAVDKIKFTFKIFYLGIMSKFVLLLIPITLALIALGLGYDFTWAVEATLRLIILSEGISIVTNTISIREKKVYENRDYLSIILHWVRSQLIKLFDSTINDKNKENDK
jgi:phage-related holin